MFGVTKYLVIVAVLCKCCLLVGGTSDSIASLLLKSSFKIIASNFEKQCTGLPQYDNITKIIDTFASTLDQLPVTDIIVIAGGPGLGPSGKITDLVHNAIDAVYQSKDDSNKVYRSYYKNIIANINISQLFQLLFRQNEKLNGILSSAMVKACKNFPDAKICDNHIALITCLENSLALQNTLNEILQNSGHLSIISIN